MLKIMQLSPIAENKNQLDIYKLFLLVGYLLSCRVNFLPRHSRYRAK